MSGAAAIIEHMNECRNGLAEGAMRLSDIIDEFIDGQRRIAMLQAQQARLLAEAFDHASEQISAPSLADTAPRDIPMRSVAAELAAATRMSDRVVQARMSDAATLIHRFPTVFRAFAEGRIDRSHADIIAASGMQISDDDARERYETAVLTVAERETPGRLRPIARLLAQRIHPVPLDERHRRAAADRRVWLRDHDEGMAEFGGLFPAERARAMYDRATQLTRAVVDARHAGRAAQSPDGTLESLDGALERLEVPLEGSPQVSTRDTRTFDEVRADVVTDLLLTGHGSPETSSASIPAADAIRARVQIVVPVLALLGVTDEPADLVGHGPIPLETARRLAAEAPGWDRVLTHPVSGVVLSVDRYRPSNELRRALAVRDEHCRFPGCRMPTWRCDADHTVDHAFGGATEIANLAHLCRRHHTLKHYSAWRVRQRTDGTLEWTSPTGRVHEDTPARTLAFVASGDPPVATEALAIPGDPPF